MKRTAYSPHMGIYVHGLKSDVKNDMSVQHYHDAYEIYFQLKGKRYVYLDNLCYTMSRGDVMILKPFELHYAQSRECDYYERYVVNFSKEIFGSILSDSELHVLFQKLDSGIVHFDEEHTQMLETLFVLAEKNSRKTGFLADKLLTATVLQIIATVIESYNERISGESIDLQIAKAIRYIEKNYRSEVSLEEISDFVGLSKYHFSRQFSKITGATAMQYLSNVRLSRVHSLLLNTKLTLGEIAEQTGFTSSENLSRVFKKHYGTTPATFRKLSKNCEVKAK